jgi:hypothetical protein
MAELKDRIAALEADNAALLELLRTQGRTVRCPKCEGIGSRTCSECDGGEVAPLAPAIAAALAQPHPGAALLEEHRKALVRARNGGLEKAARLVCEMRSSRQRVAEHLRAMKEPEE